MLSPRRFWLETTCRRGIKGLLWLWAALSAWNMVIAVRAPICAEAPAAFVTVKTVLFDASWKFGLSCRIHRAIVALSIILLYAATPESIVNTRTEIC